jgi:hypothetical protein
MSSNPNQRKELSLEKLNTLREQVCQAYLQSKGDVLQTPNNKNSPYYTDLKDDIFFKTKNVISEGTLLKLFHDDIKRTYRLHVINSIEKYIQILQISFQPEVEDKIKLYANRIYIELITRKAGILIDDENDVIEELYNSWYKLFCIIRDELKALPLECLKDQSNPETAQGISINILNQILRPHLTKFQAKYRHWIAKAKESHEYEACPPQELQKNYPEYEALMKSLKDTNKSLIECAEKLSQFFNPC